MYIFKLNYFSLLPSISSGVFLVAIESVINQLLHLEKDFQYHIKKKIT